MKYHRQFLKRLSMRPVVPVEELATREQFDDTWLAVMRFGLLCNDILTAAWNYTYQDSLGARVWPTGQQFRMLRKNTYEVVEKTSAIIEGVR
jgi:hypothetical protein